MTMLDSTVSALRRLYSNFELDEAQLAAAGFLARYGGRTLEAYRHDLRGFFQWAADAVHPHMLRAAFITAALDAGVPLRGVQLAARQADLRTTTIYDRRRQNFDRHAAYVVVAFVAGG
jgi:site-specific recombinase XerC